MPKFNKYNSVSTPADTDLFVVKQGTSTKKLTWATLKASVVGDMDALIYKGAIDCSGSPNYPAADAGHLYKISVAGKIGGASGEVVEAGDTIVCFVDSTAAGDQATVGANWNIIQYNVEAASETLAGKVELATDAETVTGTDTSRAVTPANVTAKMAAPGDFGQTTPAKIAGTNIAAGVTVETLAANRTVLTTDNAVLKLDPDGSDRDVTLPAEADSDKLAFLIENAAEGAGEDLVIQSDAPATLCTLLPGNAAYCTCDGTDWTVRVLLPPSGLTVDGVTGNVSVAGTLDSFGLAGLIGTPGTLGFGVGICPEADLPSGYTGLDGYTDPYSDNYGNYETAYGSVRVFIPKFYYLIGTGSNDLAVNEIEIKGIDTYSTTAAANSAGYALHRAFIDGDAEKSGFFIDKYLASKGSYGGNDIAVSVKDGLPLSTHADHNPIADLTACDSNAYFEAIDAALALPDNISHCASRFQYAALAMLSMAHGQATFAAGIGSAFYDATDNFPKGCNDNALGDSDDSDIIYVSDGYSNCGKTGSGRPFAKTTHNGQNCGVADLNGLMYEISIGVTAIASSDAIEDITRANPANVQITGHGLTTGNNVMLTGIEGGDWAALDDKIYAVTRVDDDNFTLDGVDSSGFTLAYVVGTNGGSIASGTFYAAKEATAMSDFTSGNSTATDHWGSTGVAALMDSFVPPFETGYSDNGFAQRMGSGANQVLDESTSGAGYILTGLGIAKDKDGIDTTGTDLFGKDYLYQYIRNELCLRSCAHWNHGSYAGVWASYWSGYRAASYYNVGFRAACYPE